MAPSTDNTNGDCQEVPTAPNIDVNTLLKILANPAQRSILKYLVSTTEKLASVEEISEYLAENYPDREEVDPEVAEIECHHKHLPRLFDAGLIEYDPLMGDVRYNRYRAVEQLLETVNELEN